MRYIDGFRERLLLQLFVLVAWIITLILVSFSSITVNYRSFGDLIYPAAFFYFMAAVCLWRNIRYIGVACEIIAAGFMVTSLAIISTYLAMSLKFPLADSKLIAMDQALGFDWQAWIKFVNDTPWLAAMLANAYVSFSLQLLTIPIILIALNKNKKACAFIAGYGVLCFVSSTISIWFPALGTYSVYEILPKDVPNINITFGYFFLEQFHAVRDNTDFVLSLTGSAGILTFPSVHAAVAVFIIWTMWDNIFTRYPFLLINLLMVTSTISHANHYFIDIIGGIGVAGISIVIVSYIFLGKRFGITNSTQLKPVSVR